MDSAYARPPIQNPESKIQNGILLFESDLNIQAVRCCEKLFVAILSSSVTNSGAGAPLQGQWLYGQATRFSFSTFKH
jgi:hypothetical protein